MHGKRAGLFTGIIPDSTLRPSQRVRYDNDTGEIHIFTNFPSVSLYFGASLEGMETREGKAMLAEIVSEAFFRQVASKRIEMGKDPYLLGSEIYNFNSVINELQRKYLRQIHEMIASSNSLL